MNICLWYISLQLHTNCYPIILIRNKYLRIAVRLEIENAFDIEKVLRESDMSIYRYMWGKCLSLRLDYSFLLQYLFHLKNVFYTFSCTMDFQMKLILNICSTRWEKANCNLSVLNSFVINNFENIQVWIWNKSDKWQYSYVILDASFGN